MRREALVFMDFAVSVVMCILKCLGRYMPEISIPSGRGRTIMSSRAAWTVVEIHSTNSFGVLALRCGFLSEDMIS